MNKKIRWDDIVSLEEQVRNIHKLLLGTSTWKQLQGLQTQIYELRNRIEGLESERKVSIVEYWRSAMNWPVDKGWKCETCGSNVTPNDSPTIWPTASFLIWGMIHGECRCVICHTQYMMRDRELNIVTKPINQLKPGYKAAARIGFQAWRDPINTWTDEQWDIALKWAEKECEHA